MPRITIDLPEETLESLEQASLREGRPINELIAESLRASVRRWEAEAIEIVRDARRRSALSEAEAEMLARKESRS